MIFFVINFFASWISSGFDGLNYQLDYSFFLSFFDPTCDLQKFKIFVDLLEEGIIIMMILIVTTLPCYYKSYKLKWSVFLFISLNLWGIGETQYLNVVIELKENAINLRIWAFWDCNFDLRSVWRTPHVRLDHEFLLEMIMGTGMDRC